MRLHAAAAFLAQSLALVNAQQHHDVNGDLEEKRRRLYEHPAVRASLLRTSDVTMKKKEESWKEIHLKKRADERHTVDQQTEAGRECDPIHQNTMPGLEADLGFLSCDPDEECVDSELSKTGGVCIKTTAQIYRRNMQTRRMQAADRCDDPTCTCDNFDATTYMGSIRCTYREPYCTPSSDIKYCYIVYLTLNYSGSPSYDNYSFCYYFTSGRFDRVCQLLNPYEGRCEIDVDGETCPLCLLEDCPEDNELVSGVVWDCTGTTLDSQGKECEGDVLLPFQVDAGTSAPSAAPVVAVDPETVAPVTAAPVTATPVTAVPVIVPTTSAPVTEAPSSVPSFTTSTGPSSAPSAAPIVTTTAPVTTVPATEPPTPPPLTQPPTVFPVPVMNPPTVFPVAEPPVAPRPDTSPPTTGDKSYSMSMSFDARRMVEDFMDEADLFEFGRAVV